MPNLFFTTFNCAKLPQYEFLSDFRTHLPPQQPDFFIFAFQELSSLIACFDHSIVQSLLKDYSSTLKTVLSQVYTQQAVNIVGYESLGGVGLVLLTSIPSDVDLEYETSSQSCGIYNSNLKGGVAIRIVHEKQRYTFVSCHLTANSGFATKRDKDYWTIIKNLRFDDNSDEEPSSDTLFRNDGHVFILGDLNYRVKKSIEVDDVDPIVKYQLNKDELLQSIKNHRAFSNLTESKIAFPPTYKFFVGTGSYKGDRIPSWCDRILYQHYPEGSVESIKYDSIRTVTTSDHQPVTLYLRVNGLPKETVDAYGHIIYHKTESTYEFLDENNSSDDDLLGEPTYEVGRVLRSSDFERLWLTGSGKVVDFIIWSGLFGFFTKVGRGILVAFILATAYFLYH